MTPISQRSLKRPQIFIASSSEGLPYAEAAFSEIERFAEPLLWDQDVFRPSKSALESLELVLDRVSHGLVVVSPDDERTMRAETAMVPRDNVLFELGLLIGRLGRGRVFMLAPREGTPTLPTDLGGVTYLTYQERSDNNYLAAVKTAIRVLRMTIDDAPRDAGAPASFLAWHAVQDRHDAGTDLRTMVAKCHDYVYLSGITLNYAVQFSHRALTSALSRGAVVEVLVPSRKTMETGLYEPFKSNAHTEATISRARWSAFYASLSEECQSRFKLLTTDLFVTHSTGIYDGRMFVNPYCAGCESADVPSVEIPQATAAYGTYLTDASEHLRLAELCLGTSRRAHLLALRDRWLAEHAT